MANIPVKDGGGSSVNFKTDGVGSDANPYIGHVVVDALNTGSIVPGTGATALGKAVDTALGATDTGVLSLAVRDDAVAQLTPVDNDLVPFRTDASGNLWSRHLRLEDVILGSHLKVELINSVPSGTNNMGDVDVLSLIPGTGATNLGKAVDTALGATDTGVLSLAVRDDSVAQLTPADNDLVPFRTDASGNLWARHLRLEDALNGSHFKVELINSLPSGTNNVGDVDVLSLIPGVGATNLGKAIDTAVGATDTGVMSLAVRDDVLTQQTPANDDLVPFRTDASGSLWVRDIILQNALIASQLRVDLMSAVPSGANNIGNVALYNSLPSGTNQIGSTTLFNSLPSGTNNIGGVTGDVAHDAANAGAPLHLGGGASVGQPAVVADADRVRAWFDLHGQQHVRAGHQGAAGDKWTANNAPSANAQATVTKAAGAGDVRNVCTDLTVMLTAGATAPTASFLTVSLVNGAAGGTGYLWRATLGVPATAGVATGIAMTGLWFVSDHASALTLEFQAAGGANVIESVTMSGVTITE